MRVSFNWLKDYVDIRISPEALAEKLTLTGFEVTSATRLERDTIWEIEVTSNRADCLSIIGIAREVAALLNKRLKFPKAPSFRGSSSATLPIQIQEKEKCPRYLGRVIKNVEVRSSPDWLIQRLEAMGIRAANNIVDITNFCLLESGQPLHAFDLDKLQGPRLIVRCAREDERIVTIDGLQRQLQPDMLVIADKLNPVAIAGIMGGKDSEVVESTKNILLESAYFEPLGIGATSRKLGLASQSSYRFERGVNFAGVATSSLRATELIQKLAKPAARRAKGLIIGRLIEKGAKAKARNRVQLKLAKVGQLLGVEVTPRQIKDFLRRLQFSVVRKSKQGLVAEVPCFRADIRRPADLIEEIARLFGYDKIPLSTSCLTPNLSFVRSRRLHSEEAGDSIRQVLVACGLNEIMTYSLISRQALRKLELPELNTITITNPLSYEQEVLRPTLLVGMLNALLTNINRKNINLKLFELSRIYKRDAPLETKQLNAQKTQPAIKELTNLCIGMAGQRGTNWLSRQGELNFFDLKGVVETLLKKLGIEDFRFAEGEFPVFITGRCANVLIGEESLGFLGELRREILDKFDISSAVYAAEIQAHKLLSHIRQERKFKPLTRFPSAARDISLVVPQQVRSEEIVSVINKIGGGLIAKVILFDQYFGEQIPQGKRGLAYSIEYRSKDATLSADEVDRLHQRVRQAVAEELGAQLR